MCSYIFHDFYCCFSVLILFRCCAATMTMAYKSSGIKNWIETQNKINYGFWLFSPICNRHEANLSRANRHHKSWFVLQFYSPQHNTTQHTQYFLKLSNTFHVALLFYNVSMRRQASNSLCWSHIIAIFYHLCYSISLMYFIFHVNAH